MKFRRSSRARSSLRINLTSLIDTVFLLLMFFMMTTTFNKSAQLEISLPEATHENTEPNSSPIIRIVIDAQGQYAIDDSPRLLNNELNTLVNALTKVSTSKKDPIVLISADAQAPHQYVIRAMEAARNTGLVRLSFETQEQKAP